MGKTETYWKKKIRREFDRSGREREGREKGFETERGEGDRDGGGGGRVQDVKMGVRLGTTCRLIIGLVSNHKVNL